MRHRLFHAIVMVGASLPMACGSDDPSTTPTPPVDSGFSSSDALLTSDSAADTNVNDTSVVDTGKPDTGAVVDAAEDVCDGGCGSSCFPCIK